MVETISGTGTKCQLREMSKVQSTVTVIKIIDGAGETKQVFSTSIGIGHGLLDIVVCPLLKIGDCVDYWD